MLVNPLIIGKFDNLTKAPNNHVAANTFYERLSENFSTKQPTFVYTILRLSKKQSGGSNNNIENNYHSYIVKEVANNKNSKNKIDIDFTIAKYGGSVDYESLSTNLQKISDRIKYHTENNKLANTLFDSDSSNDDNIKGGAKKKFNILDDDFDDDDDDDEFDTALDDFDNELRSLSLKKRRYNKTERLVTPFLPSPYVLPFPYLRSILTDDIINTYVYSSIYDDLTRIFIPTFTILSTEILATQSASSTPRMINTAQANQTTAPTPAPAPARTPPPLVQVPQNLATQVLGSSNTQPRVIVLK